MSKLKNTGLCHSTLHLLILLACINSSMAKISPKYQEEDIHPIKIKSNFQLNMNDIFDMTQLDIDSFEFHADLESETG